MNKKYKVCNWGNCVNKAEIWYCPQHIKKYNKTWYWAIRRHNTWPKNLVSGRPIRIFGIYLFCVLQLAKKNYKWAKY